MTFREKLTTEHPECVGEGFCGGCADCPKHYGYEEENLLCFEMYCKECWNREMPEEQTK